MVPLGSGDVKRSQGRLHRGGVSETGNQKRVSETGFINQQPCKVLAYMHLPDCFASFFRRSPENAAAISQKWLHNLKAAADCVYNHRACAEMMSVRVPFSSAVSLSLSWTVLSASDASPCSTAPSSAAALRCTRTRGTDCWGGVGYHHRLRTSSR